MRPSTLQQNTSISRVFVLGAPVPAMMLATWWVRSPVDDRRGGQADGHSGTRSPKKMSDTCIYNHVQSCSQAQVSLSLNVSCVVFLGCGFRQTSKVEETLDWQVSCTLAQVVRTNASSNVRAGRRRSFRIILDPMTPCVSEPHMEVSWWLGARLLAMLLAPWSVWISLITGGLEVPTTAATAAKRFSP